MKYTVALVAVASVALAQDVPTQLVSCANECVTKFTTGTLIAGCQQGDIECVCRNDSFLDEIACCLADVCSEEDQKSAVRYAGSLCAGAGVEVPDEVVCKDKPAGDDSSSDDDSSSGDDNNGDSSDDSSSNDTSSDNGGASQDNNDSAAGKVAPVVGLIGAFMAAVAML